MLKMNSSSSSLVLLGFEQLLPVRWLLLLLFLFVWLFVLLSDSLVIFVIVTRSVLHRPMFIFIAAVLSNSLMASNIIYPKLLRDLGQMGLRPGLDLSLGLVKVSLGACLTQAFLLHAVGSSSFMLLGAMALDRYVSIMFPLRYTVLMSPWRVLCLLLFCWVCPLVLVGIAIVLASRLPLCSGTVHRIYCDPYTVVSMSCPGTMAQLTAVYGLFMVVLVLFVPGLFVVFSYGRILLVCLFHSRSYSRNALKTCVPHIAVFLNYLLSAAFELFHRRVSPSTGASAGVSPPFEKVGTAASLLTVMIPTIFNPLVYGLKVSEIYRQINTLLRR